MTGIEQQLRDYFVEIEPTVPGPDAFDDAAAPRTDVLTLSSTSEPTMNTRLALLSAAAVAVIAVLIGVVAFGGDDGTTVGPADTTTTISSTTEPPATTAAAAASDTTGAPTTTEAEEAPDVVASAEEILDAMLSLDLDALRELGPEAAVYDPLEWWVRLEAAAALTVLDRSACVEETASRASCTVAFEDDLDRALSASVPSEIALELRTDPATGEPAQARLEFVNSPEWDAASAWTFAEQREIWTGPCEDLGSSAFGDADACVTALLAGFADWNDAGSPGL